MLSGQPSGGLLADNPQTGLALKRRYFPPENNSARVRWGMPIVPATSEELKAAVRAIGIRCKRPTALVHHRVRCRVIPATRLGRWRPRSTVERFGASHVSFHPDKEVSRA